MRNLSYSAPQQSVPAVHRVAVYVICGGTQEKMFVIQLAIVELGPPI